MRRSRVGRRFFLLFKHVLAAGDYAVLCGLLALLAWSHSPKVDLQSYHRFKHAGIAGGDAHIERVKSSSVVYHACGLQETMEARVRTTLPNQLPTSHAGPPLNRGTYTSAKPKNVGTGYYLGVQQNCLLCALSMLLTFQDARGQSMQMKTR